MSTNDGNYFAFTTDNKNIKLAFPLGFPPIRSNIDDVASDVTRRSYFWYRFGKWTPVSYATLKKYLTLFLEDNTKNNALSTFFLYNAATRRNVSDILNKILLLDTEPLKPLQKPEYGACYIFFTNSICLINKAGD